MCAHTTALLCTRRFGAPCASAAQALVNFRRASRHRSAQRCPTCFDVWSHLHLDTSNACLCAPRVLQFVRPSQNLLPGLHRRHVGADVAAAGAPRGACAVYDGCDARRSRARSRPRPRDFLQLCVATRASTVERLVCIVAVARVTFARAELPGTPRAAAVRTSCLRAHQALPTCTLQRVNSAAVHIAVAARWLASGAPVRSGAAVDVNGYNVASTHQPAATHTRAVKRGHDGHAEVNPADCTALGATRVNASLQRPSCAAPNARLSHKPVNDARWSPNNMVRKRLRTAGFRRCLRAQHLGGILLHALVSFKCMCTATSMRACEQLAARCVGAMVTATW